MAAWSCSSYFDFLFDEAPHFDKDLLKDWFPTDDAQIVTPGVLALGAYADGTLKPYRQQLAAIFDEIQLPATCTRVAVGGAQLFAATVTYGSSDDPVTIAAEPMLLLLTTLYDGWKKVRSPASMAASAGGSRKPKS